MDTPEAFFADFIDFVKLHATELVAPGDPLTIADLPLYVAHIQFHGILEALDGYWTLRRFSRNYEAQGLCRNLLERLINAEIANHPPEIVCEVYVFSLKERIKQLKRFRIDVVDSANLATLDLQIHRIEKQIASWESILGFECKKKYGYLERARLAGLDDFYRGVYSHLCNYTHPPFNNETFKLSLVEPFASADMISFYSAMSCLRIYREHCGPISNIWRDHFDLLWDRLSIDLFRK